MVKSRAGFADKLIKPKALKHVSRSTEILASCIYLHYRLRVLFVLANIDNFKISFSSTYQLSVVAASKTSPHPAPEQRSRGINNTHIYVMIPNKNKHAIDECE